MVRHPTKDKGDIGVGYVIADLFQHGVQVALPISEHLPFDCIGISRAGILKRISIKYRRSRQGRVEVRLRSTWADKHGSHAHYHAVDDYDVIAIYCPDSRSCYYVRMDEVSGTTLVLRVTPAKNNQQAGIKEASRFCDPNRVFDSPGSSTG